MIFKLKVLGIENVKAARAAGAKFNPRGNSFEFEGDSLPADLARFVPGYKAPVVAAPSTRNMDGAQTLAEWQSRRANA